MKIRETTKNKKRKTKPEKLDDGNPQTDVALTKSATTKSRSAAKTSQAASLKKASPKAKSSNAKSQNAARKTTAKTKKAALPETATAATATPMTRVEMPADAVGTSNDAMSEEVADGISKADIKEAARILKSGVSKKRERRKAASVMSVAGSSKGGQNRARNLSPEKLKEIATLGGLARQAKARERAEQGLTNTRPRRAPMARSLSGDTS